MLSWGDLLYTQWIYSLDQGLNLWARSLICRLRGFAALLSLLFYNDFHLVFLTWPNYPITKMQQADWSEMTSLTIVITIVASFPQRQANETGNCFAGPQLMYWFTCQFQHNNGISTDEHLSSVNNWTCWLNFLSILQWLPKLLFLSIQLLLSYINNHQIWL